MHQWRCYYGKANHQEWVNEIYQWRFCLSKLASTRFLSHLDVLRGVERAFRRGGIRLARTKGFHHHSILSFGPALAVGVESCSEYFDADLDQSTEDFELVKTINHALTPGLAILRARPLEKSQPSLAAMLNAASYRFWLDGSDADLDVFTSLFEREELIVTRTGPNNSERRVDLKELIIAFDADRIADRQLGILSVTGNAGNLRPGDLLGFCAGVEFKRMLRTGLYHHEGNALREPMYGKEVNWQEANWSRA